MMGTMDSGVRMSFRLPVEPTAGATARRSVEKVMAPTIPPRLKDNLKLLLSELVTNSFRHAGIGGGEWIDVYIHVFQKTVRVEVTDPGAGFEIERSMLLPHERTEGWGLMLVEKIAHRWGVVTDGHTKVWFELQSETPLLEGSFDLNN